MLDVNYGGSTGYGRPYRDRLKGEWGIVDVADAVNGAGATSRGAGQGRSERLTIRGRSAGGYTTLAALTFRDVFTAGASYYGVSDLEALAARHPQVRVALPRSAGRSISGGEGASTARDRRFISPSACRARSSCSRDSRTRWCHRIRRDDGRGRAQERVAWSTSRSKASSTGSERRRTLSGRLEEELALYQERCFSM